MSVCNQFTVEVYMFLYVIRPHQHPPYPHDCVLHAKAFSIELVVTYYSEILPCGKTCAVTGWSSSTSKSKLTTSHIRVCWSPKVITHSPPVSTVVDFQTTRCVGPAGKSISHQPQVTRTLTCNVLYYVWVCNNFWGNVNCEVVGKELGCPPPLQALI